MINEIKKFQPEIYKFCKKALSKKLLDLDFQRLDKKSFESCDDISIDKAIMEKTTLGMVIPLEAGWSDIGSWKTLWEVSTKEHNGNVLSGNIVNKFTQNCLIKSDKKLVAAIGIKDLIIVDTNDAVLIVIISDLLKGSVLCKAICSVHSAARKHLMILTIIITIIINK